MSNKDVITDYFQEHRRFIKPTKFANLQKLQIGDVIQFIYNKELKTVLVTNPKWQKKLHGLSLNAIPRKLFLPLIQEVKSEKSAKLFYTSKVKPNPIGPRHAYRTYSLESMSNLKIVNYDSLL